MTYVSSAAEDPPEERTHCGGCGDEVCAECHDCPGYDETCNAPLCRCPRWLRFVSGIPDDRWQEALDDATDGAVDDAKVREAEGS